MKSSEPKPLSPVDEFHHILDRIEHRIMISRESYREKLFRDAKKLQEQSSSSSSETPKRKGFGRFLIRGRSSDETTTTTTGNTSTANTATDAAATITTPPRIITPAQVAAAAAAGVSTSTLSTPNASPSRNSYTTPSGPIADFIPMEQMEVMIEDLRRIAELCIIGENFVTKVQKKQDQAQMRAQRKWAAARDVLLEDVSESEPAYDETSTDYLEKLQLFDLFFERNALLTIVNMLHGDAFSLEKHPPPPTNTKGNPDLQPPPSHDRSSSELNHSISSIPETDIPIVGNDSTAATATLATVTAPATPTPTTITTTLLPPLSVATQALQSISILIQNVSRVTSLYAMLSNNNINTLIDLPLHLYTVAEKRRYLATTTTMKSSTSSVSTTTLPAIFASPPITELSTHFVTFLKSLALRMNAETLQFFIKYHHRPSDSSSASLNHDRQDDHDTLMPSTTTSEDNINVLQNVEFPLYVRALEFCAAHQDSFVRTTALNICLNTIRLTTITNSSSSSSHENDVKDSNESQQQQSSPNAILHNAKELPYQERLVIAQYACIPSRVEHLISPIFTKLAEHWTAIDEQVRLIDSNKHMGYNEMNDDVGVRNERVALAKEKVRRDRLLRNFKDKVADLQDELLLLDDVFQVSFHHDCKNKVDSKLTPYITI